MKPFKITFIPITNQQYATPKQYITNNYAYELCYFLRIATSIG